MKSLMLIFSVVMLNTISVAQGDSTNINKWQPKHGVGFELGGDLLFYSLFYEYSRYKNKNTFAINYKTAFTFTHKNKRFGNGVSLSYRRGKHHQITFDLSQSLYVQTGAFNNKYKNDHIWEVPSPYISLSSFSLGYRYNLKRKPFSIFAKTMIIFMVNEKYNIYEEKAINKSFSPYISIGITRNCTK